MLSALTANSSSLLGGSGTTSSISQLSQQMQARLQAQVQTRTQALDDSLQSRQDAIGVTEDRLIHIKGDINTAKMAFDNGLENIDKVQDTLLALRSAVSSAENSVSLARTDFDMGILSINTTVNIFSPAMNTTGNLQDPNWTPNTISYIKNTNLGQRDVSGTYAGTDFKITLSDGTIWRPESGSTILQKFNPDGTLDDNMDISMMNGVELQSYNADTGEITVNVIRSAEEAPIQVTGTLSRGGLGVMPSWFYRSQSSIDAGLDAMSTQEDWDLARADITTATNRLNVSRATIEAGSAQVASDMGKIDSQLDETTAQKRAALNENLKERMEMQAEVQSQTQIMLMNLSRASSVQQQYVNMFAATSARNPFLSVET